MHQIEVGEAWEESDVVVFFCLIMSCGLVLYYMCFSNKHHSNQWHLSMNRAFYTYYNKTNETKIGGGQKLSELKSAFRFIFLSAAATPYRIVYSVFLSFCLMS